VTDEEFERAFPIEENPFSNKGNSMAEKTMRNPFQFTAPAGYREQGNNTSFSIPSLGQMYGQTMTPINRVSDYMGQSLTPNNRVSDYMSRFNNLSGYTLPENSTDYSSEMLDTFSMPDMDFYDRYNDGRTPAGPPGGGKDPGPDYLGWGQVLTGGLQGISGILDYFNKKAGLKLTEDAINKKYAHADREFLGRATTADNILAGRKHFIEKTHADPDSSHLQYINRSNA